jgi:hypothetical protein
VQRDRPACGKNNNSMIEHSDAYGRRYVKILLRFFVEYVVAAAQLFYHGRCLRNNAS